MAKVLIADDETHIRLLLEQTLEDFEDEGVEILTAQNGLEALALARSERPDLIFLDVMMPGMNGFDVCEAIKADNTLKHLHVVILTAKGQAFDRKRGESVGADDYKTKPFDPDDIIAKASRILGIQL